MEYYDRKSELLKTAIFSEYKKIGGVWRVGKIVMTNHQSGKKDDIKGPKFLKTVDRFYKEFQAKFLVNTFYG